MQFCINNASGRAAYQQIIDQVKSDIALGRLAVGQQLPTVRQLAGQLAINPNTIAKAYRALEHEGIITTRPGAGAFVCDTDSNLSNMVKKKMIIEGLERVVVDAFHMQIDRGRLSQWFNSTLDKFKWP